MSIVYLTLAIILVLLYSLNHISYNMKYNELMKGGKFTQFISGVLAAISAGIAWIPS